MARVALIAAIVAASIALAPLQRRGGASPPRSATPKVATAATCAADLGVGATSKRQFCDIVIATMPAESVVVPIPARSGAATLMFDLHNRFPIPVASATPAEAFARHSALVAIVRPDGAIIDRAVVTREFRTAQDLFDQLGGGRPGGVKAIGPGHPIPVKVVLPADITAVGIVGVRLEQVGLGTTETYDAPGRPIAIASNVRVEYTPR